jgi:hypothetical protein
MRFPSCAERGLAAPINKMNKRNALEREALTLFVVIIYFVSERPREGELFSNLCLYSAYVGGSGMVANFR